MLKIGSKLRPIILLIGVLIYTLTVHSENKKRGTCNYPVMTSFVSSIDSICKSETVTLTINGLLNHATAWHLYSGSCGGTLVSSNSSGVFTVSPSSSTSYFIRGEGFCVTPGACLSLSITVSPTYSKSENFNLCKGESYTFPDSTIINDIQSQVVHTSILTSKNWCDSSIVTTIDVISTDTGIDVSGNTLTSRDSISLHQWIDCESQMPIPNETSKGFVALNNGSYSVELTKGQCVDTSACYEVTGLTNNSLISNDRLKLFPNPANGFTNLYFSKPVSGKIEILNVSGEIIHSELIKDLLQVKLNINNQPKGIYFIRVNSSNENLTRKVLKL